MRVTYEHFYQKDRLYDHIPIKSFEARFNGHLF